MSGMCDHDWRQWLHLMLIPGLGNQSALKLLARFGLPQNVLNAETLDLMTCVSAKIVKNIKDPLSDDQLNLIEKTSLWLQQEDNAILYLGHPDYPAALLEIPDPPVLLYAKGNLAYLSKPLLAVVGSRNASMQGIQHAESFSIALSQNGWCISSGLAAGVDTAAHSGGLQGEGGTVAVIGTGIDIVYPARNRELAHRITKHGCIISEYHLGTAAHAANFPRRNRIISGLARGVLVVEAAAQSGSLITARMAAEQGREVFAIPGSIHSPLARGCHLLIKQGAKLVESAQDILEELGELNGKPLAKVVQNSENLENTSFQNLLTYIGYDPISFDVLSCQSGYAVSDLSAMIFELEMKGVLETLPGGLIQRLN